MSNKNQNNSSKVSRTFSISLENWKKLDALQKDEKLKTLSEAADLAISRGLLLLKPYTELIEKIEQSNHKITGLEKVNIRLKAMMSPKTQSLVEEVK